MEEKVDCIFAYSLILKITEYTHSEQLLEMLRFTHRGLPSSTRFRNIFVRLNHIYVPWFYAIDVPNSKPYLPTYQTLHSPKKFKPFSVDDSNRLEKASKRQERRPVLVNEDYLFKVDLSHMELSPTYWEGPTYQVRRGVWFDSSNQPLSSDLTSEIEGLYKQLKFDDSNDDPTTTPPAESQDIFRLKGKYPVDKENEGEQKMGPAIKMRMNLLSSLFCLPINKLHFYYRI